MKTNFLYRTEYSVIGNRVPVLCGLEVNGTLLPFTGACAEVENFGISASELALFANKAESVHFESELEHIPVRGAGLNEKVKIEQICVLTVRAIANGEIINAANLSRVVSRY